METVDVGDVLGPTPLAEHRRQVVNLGPAGKAKHARRRRGVVGP
jgi:hypothetical protein